jgi:hypothetical protein
MRALLALLLLANLVFLALSRGWLEPYAGLSAMHQREPQRLAAQIEPDSVRVLAPPPAGWAAPVLPVDAAPRPAAAPSDSVPACVQAGPFAADALPAAEAVLQQMAPPAPAWQRVRGAQGATWLRIDGADVALRRRLAELPLPGEGFVPCP